MLYAAAIVVPAVAHRWGSLNAVAAFWAAYVITRPLGASVADWMAVGHGRVAGVVEEGGAEGAHGLGGLHDSLTDSAPAAHRGMRNRPAA